MKKLFQAPWSQKAIAWATAAYLRLVVGTLRWRVEGEAQIHTLSREAPVIVAFWHEALPAMPVIWLRARRQNGMRPAVILASRHRDGQLVGLILGQMGVEMVAGSTSRGGVAGLRTMIQALKDGKNVAIAPDGPRGPRRVCAPGAAQMAASSGRPVVPCAALTSRAITFNSWDRMRLPLPFGRGVLVCGAPVSVSREDWQAGLARITEGLNAAMDRAAALL